MSNIFFSAGYYFSQEFRCMPISSRNQSAGYFFSEIIHKPLKSQIVGPDRLQSSVKPFETKGDKTL